MNHYENDSPHPPLPPSPCNWIKAPPSLLELFRKSYPVIKCVKKISDKRTDRNLGAGHSFVMLSRRSQRYVLHLGGVHWDETIKEPPASEESRMWMSRMSTEHHKIESCTLLSVTWQFERLNSFWFDAVVELEVWGVALDLGVPQSRHNSHTALISHVTHKWHKCE